MRPAAAIVAASLSCFGAGNIISDVRESIAKGDYARGEQLISEFRARSGVTPEMVEALSWLGRGSLAARRFENAERYADETRKLALDLLKTRKLDDERRLPIALGASIEVHAQTLAARGQRSEAVEFLNSEIALWGKTSILERLRKNLNLLTLEGKLAPALTADHWLGAQPPANLKTRPQLIFLWAHWCGDCKSMATSIATLHQKYASKGLAVIGPTKLYGYVARGEDATPAVELPYIDEVRKRFYLGIGEMPVPVGPSIFQTYGVSTTPTIVLVDRTGIVRLYHPGAMPEAELDGKIAAMLGK